ncbi:hypothetical protein ACB092_06G057700 [Castanea dentata]
MSILAQHKYPLSSKHHVYTCLSPCLRTHVHCSATTTTTTTTKPRPNLDQLVIEPQLNPSQTLVTSPPSRPILNDPSLRSTWAHRAWVASGCSTVMISLAKSIMGAAESHMWLEPILASLVGYILADLGSGVYHWGIDNYGSASTPIFGAQIDAFQGHHKWPWTITRRQFANNLHALARAVTFTVLPMDLASNDPIFLAFVGVCSGCIMFSQQFHAWAHTTKSRLPALVIALQDMGLLVSRSQHADHHRSPYNNNYCIVSGVWNEFLDKQQVFEALEMILFFKLGVRPRSWSDPSSDWTEEIETSSQITAH